MYLRTKGKPKHFPIKEAKKAVHFYASELLTSKMSERIETLIWFSKEEAADRGFSGVCMWVDDNIRPREFLITIDPSLRKKRMLQILAHEMTHLKQQVYGELKDIQKTKNTMKWKGKVYKCKSGFFGVDPTKEKAYMSQPWEKESRKNEKILYERYKLSAG